MADSSPANARFVLLHSEPSPPRQANALGRTAPNQIVTVSVIVCRRQPLDLAALGGRQLSREEFARTYAADPASFDQVRAFAAEHGLTVDDASSSLDRRTVVLRGTVENMERAFGVQMQDYESGGRRYHAYTGSISVPQQHGSIIEAVFGLDGRPIAKPHFRRLASRTPLAAAQSYTPPQVAQVYSFPTDANGAGQTVAILELGGGFQQSDLTSYFGKLGLATPSVSAVSVDGASNAPGDPNGADGEVLLDIEVVGAVAPGAKIVVFFAPNTDQGFIDCVTTAIHDPSNPSVLSISWGGPEDTWPAQARTSLDNVFQSAAALGVTVTVACGDNGSSDGETDGANHVDFPASSPHVLACGGTTLVASNGRRTQETVWNDLGAGGGATGGGVSTVFPLPSWQSGAKVPAPTVSGGGRGLPDVAGDASPETGYQVLVDGQQQVIGGTSAVAPLWAGLVALLNQRRGKSLGFLNPALYQAAGQAGSGAFFDITSGSNGAFNAGPGWDACTGLGSPVGTGLETALG